MSNLPYTIRRATEADTDSLVQFNVAIAWETESKKLDPSILRSGLGSLLRGEQPGFYLVAEAEGVVIASLMITTEWSDWRNGTFWWIQSVYVVEAFRRRGVYSELYRHVGQLASQEKNVCGFRLYVERDNQVAQQTYQRNGMAETPYRVYEHLAPLWRWTL